jgi:hypothetical protein
MSLRDRLGKKKGRNEGSVPTDVKTEKGQEQLLFEKYFKDNEVLLKSIRSLLLGLPVSSEQKALIKNTFSDELLYTYIRKRFYPTYKDESAQIGGLIDVYLGVEQMCFAQEPHVIEQAVKYKEVSLELTRKGLSLLLDPDKKGVKIDLDAMILPIDKDPLQISLLGRNIYIRHIDKQLSVLYVVANADKMTPQEIQKRLQLDSAQ